MGPFPRFGAIFSFKMNPIAIFSVSDLCIYLYTNILAYYLLMDPLILPDIHPLPGVSGGGEFGEPGDPPGTFANQLDFANFTSLQ